MYVMPKVMQKFVWVVLVGLAFGAAPGTAEAQAMRTVTIREGRVFVDGEPLPPHAVPPSLKLDGLDRQYGFAGNAEAVIEVDGTLYRLDGSRLLEVKESPADPVTVLFRGGAVEPALSLAPTGAAFTYRMDRSTDVLRQQAALLETQAAEMYRVQRQLDLSGHEYERVAAQWRDVAQQLTQAAQQLPRLEWQSYLGDVAQQNAELYHRLLEEERLEEEARALVAEVRRQYSRAQQEVRVRMLRSKLEAIFELKQANRRAEIRQLEADLEELKQSLQERERRREEIVERRLRELLAEPLRGEQAP